MVLASFKSQCSLEFNNPHKKSERIIYYITYMVSKFTVNKIGEKDYLCWMHHSIISYIYMMNSSWQNYKGCIRQWPNYYLFIF